MGLRNSSGKWQYRFVLQGQSVSVQTGLEATERNRKKAEQQEAAHRLMIREGRWGFRPLTPREFKAAVPDFVAWAGMEYPAASTARRYKTSLASSALFFDRKLVSTIEPGDVEQYKVWRRTAREGYAPVKPVTLRHDLDALSVFFAWALKGNLARQNPLAEVTRPSDRDAISQRILTAVEEKCYFASAKGNLHDVGRIMILQGCRPEEVMRIRREDVDLEHKSLHIRFGKTLASKRTLRLTQESLSILGVRMSGSSQWIFPSSRRPGQHIAKLDGPHDRICEKLKLYFRLYDLRHTFATRLAEAGVDAFAIAAILGHPSTRILSRYVHPTQAHQDAAMQAIDKKNTEGHLPESIQ